LNKNLRRRKKMKNNLKCVAQKLAEGNEAMILIRRIINKEHRRMKILLFVERNSPSYQKGDKIDIFYFWESRDDDGYDGGGNLSLKDYKSLLKGGLKLDDEYELGEVLFDGTLEYTNPLDIVRTIRDKRYPYAVKPWTDVDNLRIGFECESGRRWAISCIALKSAFEKNPSIVQKLWTTVDGRRGLADRMNMKLIYSGDKNEE
jgi:hypothetical protein